MNLPITITIPKFVRKIKVSEKQRATYFEWNGIFIKGKGKKIPISFFKDRKNIPIHPKLEDLKEGFSICEFQKNRITNIYLDSLCIPNILPIKGVKFYLCKTVNDLPEPIICYPKRVGTPKYYLIKGQDIYSGNLREHFKGMVMDKIKESYMPYVKDMPVIDSYPIKIDCLLYETIKNVYDRSDGLGQRWDVDNYLYPYLKAFPDLLTTLKKLKDDDRLHFPGAIKPDFVPIDNHEDRKLVFTISIDDREEIKNNKIFQDYHKDFNAGFHRNEITGETEDSELRDIKFEDDNKPCFGDDEIYFGEHQ